MSNSIRPEGWTKWDTATNTSLIYYAEYKSKYFNSTLIDTSKRVNWSYQLTDAEASSYTPAALFREWNPETIYDQMKLRVKAIAVSNFKVKRDSVDLLFTWNISWPMSKLLYTLYRSADNKNFKVVNSVVAVSDSIVNFELKDKVPQQNVTYYYYLKASHKGNASHTTNTWKISADKISVVSSL